jgi:hypothetical protein
MKRKRGDPKHTTSPAIFKRALKLLAIPLALVLATAPMPSSAEEEAENSDEYLGDGHVDPGEDEAADLARAVQNPVADLISVPFQNNTNFDFGPRERTQNVLNIQPVVPFSLSDDWLMITRAIIPIVSQPSLFPGQDRKNGLGDILLTGFVSPSNQDLWIGGKVLWGAGPAILLPTATDNQIGPGQLGAGPSAVFIAMPGQWVIGSLFSQVWSFTGGSDVDLFTWQYFVNYNLPKGWYLTSSPIITANWKNKSSDTWTVPVGGGFGRVFRVGSLPPMNTSLVAFYNVENPRNVGPDWTLRFTLQFLFPR